MTKTIHDCDIVHIETKDKRIFEGMLLPASDDTTVVLKLASGYNIGILKKNIKSTAVKKKFAQSKAACVTKLEKQKKLHKPVIHKELQTITILHTGGTIASEVDYETGGTIARFTPEEIIAMFPEITEHANIESRLMRNMWSENMKIQHFNLMAEEIAKEVKKGASGVIVTHGTDTLAYTAAALSFILEDLPIPVILVGAQRSSDRPSSDAAMNLLAAARFMTKTDFADVGICMHASTNSTDCIILPGCKTRKLHSSRRDAFQAVNTTPVAIISGKVIRFVHKHYRKRGERQLKVRLINPKKKVGVVHVHPHMRAEELKLYESYDAVILEGTGLGHAPVGEHDEFTGENKKILAAIKRLAKKIPVAITTQCIFGRVNMNVYSNGRILKDTGVLGDHLDMLTETAYVKMAWLVSHYNDKKVHDLYSQNLRGELSERTVVKEAGDMDDF